MLSAMNKGISGLENFQKSIEVVGNNLSNINTPGYRAKRMLFQEMAGGHPREAGIGGGATVGCLDTITTQGELTATGVPTDLAIQGEGFFILAAADGRQRFTRDGSFQVDSDGYLTSGAGGLRLQGYGTRDDEVDLASGLRALRIPLGKANRAQASSALTVTGNLDASATPYSPASEAQAESGGVVRVRTTILDTLGRSHGITLILKCLGGQSWSWEVQPSNGSTDVVENATGTIEFDSQGQARTTDLSFRFRAEGVLDQAISLDSSGLGRLAGTTSATVKANGLEPGELQSFSIDSDGFVTGVYSNGLQETLGRLALATFRSPSALASVGGNLLAVTAESGPANVSAAGSSGPGAVLAGSLEGSNVDVSAELTRLVLTQRAFQSNSRLIRAADEMWQDLLDIGR